MASGKSQRAPTHSKRGAPALTHRHSRHVGKSLSLTWLYFRLLYIYPLCPIDLHGTLFGFKDFLCSHCLNGVVAKVGSGWWMLRWHGCSNLHLTQFRGTQKTFAVAQPPEHATRAPPPKNQHPIPPTPFLWGGTFSLSYELRAAFVSPIKSVWNERVQRLGRRHVA